MKRLLSYLIMLMGFAMIFSTNSHAKLIFCVDITKNISKVDKPVTVIRKYSLTKKIECKQIANNYSFEIDKKSPVYKNIKKEFKKRSNGSRPRNKNYTLDEFKALVGSQNFYLFKNYDDVLKTTTASASLDNKICEKYKKQWKKQTYDYCKSFDYTKSKYYKANSMAGKSFNLDGRIVSEQDYVRYKESVAFNKNKNFTKDLANLFAQKQSSNTKTNVSLKEVQSELKTLERAIYGEQLISFEVAERIFKSVEKDLNILNYNKSSFSSSDKKLIEILNKDINTAERLIYDGKTLKRSQNQIAKAEPKKENKNLNLNNVAALIDKAKERKINYKELKNQFLVVYGLSGETVAGLAETLKEANKIALNKCKKKYPSKNEKNPITGKIQVLSYMCNDYFYYKDNNYYYQPHSDAKRNAKKVTAIINPLYKKKIDRILADKAKIQIAKKEPSKMHKTAKKEEPKQEELNLSKEFVNVVFCKNTKYQKIKDEAEKDWYDTKSQLFQKYLKAKEILIFYDSSKCPRNYINISYQDVKRSPWFQDQHSKLCYNKSRKIVYSQRNKPKNTYWPRMEKTISSSWKHYNNTTLLQYNSCAKQFLGSNLVLLKFDTYKNGLNKFIYNEDTSIAKKEPTIKPKKKVKVAKAEEPKQEELKVENKNIDNDAPVIEIAERIVVDNQAYKLTGKVKDKSRFQLTIDDRPIKVSKNGKFEFEGFAVDLNEKLKIVAIDRWQNKSEKIVNVEVQYKEVADLRSYEEPNPGKIKVKQDRNKIAIIIGIEKYRTLKNIDASYANRDANAFRAYANRALGIPNKNIKVLIDENATRAETLKALTLWLPQAARGKGKDIYIFFAGHGLASDDGKNLYILPQDGDAALLQYTAISRLQIFELINKVQPKSVTMFFDTCYSGQTRDEEMLVAGLRPIRLLKSEQEKPNNFTIFTASNYDQTSGSIDEAKHGIFSYYLMKGMEGKADLNSDKKITNGELIAYLKQNVTEEAFVNNRQQEPMLSGNPDKVLISYR